MPGVAEHLAQLDQLRVSELIEEFGAAWPFRPGESLGERCSLAAARKIREGVDECVNDLFTAPGVGCVDEVIDTLVLLHEHPSCRFVVTACLVDQLVDEWFWGAVVREVPRLVRGLASSICIVDGPVQQSDRVHAGALQQGIRVGRRGIHGQKSEELDQIILAWRGGQLDGSDTEGEDALSQPLGGVTSADNDLTPVEEPVDANLHLEREVGAPAECLHGAVESGNRPRVFVEGERRPSEPECLSERGDAPWGRCRFPQAFRNLLGLGAHHHTSQGVIS